MNHVLFKRDLNTSDATNDPLAAAPVMPPDEVMARFEPRRLAPWKESALRAIAFAEARAARILGVSGIVEGVGNSSIAAAIAQGYSDYGQRTLLIGTKNANIGESFEAANGKLLNLTRSATPIGKRLDYVDLSRVEFTLPLKPDYFNSVFQIALEYYHAIIVDLPSIVTGSGQPSPCNLAVGAACNAVLLVCETGRTTRNEIQQCLASARISGLQIAGILLNDYRLPMNRILSKF